MTDHLSEEHARAEGHKIAHELREAHFRDGADNIKLAAGYLGVDVARGF